MRTPERQTYIDKFRALPADLEAVVLPLSDEQLEYREGSGEWTVRQIVHHIAEAHMNSMARLKWPLTEDRPTIKTYDQEAWAELLDSRTLPLAPSLTILRGLHERLAALLESLTDEQWERTALHPEWGEISVDGIAQEYSGHGYVHLEQIKRALKAGLRE